MSYYIVNNRFQIVATIFTKDIKKVLDLEEVMKIGDLI